MTLHDLRILADGLSPGMIFAIFVAILVAVANMLAKKKQADATQQEMKQQRESRRRKVPSPTQPLSMDEIRREITQAAEHQAWRERTAAGVAAQERTRSKQKQKKAKPPPIPTNPPVARPAPIVQNPSASEADTPLQSHAKQSTETARNIRLMLQPGGIREAMILSEVLGKPKGLRED